MCKDIWRFLPRQSIVLGMCINMAKTIKEERLRWILPIIYHSVIFLEHVINKFKHRIESVKTDNGVIFTNRYNGTYAREDLSPKKLHVFDVCCAKHNIIYYLIDPGKPAQSGTVERSHREDQEKFYERNVFKNIQDLQTKMQLRNNEYNNLEHCGLNGKTPLEFLSDYELTKTRNIKLIKFKKPTKVLA